MKKHYLKIMILGMLIIGCIVQTVMLWLGGLPSHNFLTPNGSVLKAIKPVNVWLMTPTSGSTGSKSALAYPMSKTIHETEQQYERLIMELQEALVNMPIEVKVSRTEGIEWERLFAVPGIVYEYSVPVGLYEISGVKFEAQEAAQIQNINKVFIQSNSKFEKELTIHFMDIQNNYLYTIQVPGKFQEFSKIYDYMTKKEESNQMVKYQPSAVSNINRYIKNNTFMAIASGNYPINYRVLQPYNPISKDPAEAVKELEKYVNGFFWNPLLKEIEVKEDGNIIFMENKKGLVIYKPTGVLEYVNLSSKMIGQSTLLGSYNEAIRFIEASAAIPQTIRDNLYLSGIKKQDEIYTCYFDMNYRGFDIALTDQVRKQLEIQSLVEISVKSNQIIGAKISLIEIGPKVTHSIIQTQQLKTEYVDPINKGLEQIKKAGYESIVFEDSKTMYVMDNLSGVIYLTRGVLFEGKWYYPE